MKSAILLIAALLTLVLPCFPAEAGVGDPAAAFELAAEALSRQAYREAALGAETVLAADPGNVGALVLLGEARLGLDDASGAREVLERAASLDPEHARAAKLLGDAWRGVDAVRARENWDRAIRLDPEAAAFYGDAAWAVMYAGDLDGGMSYVRQGLARFPNDRSLLLAAAFAQFRAAQYDSVDEIIRRLMAIRIDDREVVARGIILSLATGDKETADMAMAYLDSLDDSDPFTHLAAGFYHLVIDDPDTAIKAYGEALKGELPLHDRYHAVNNLATLLAVAERYEEALEFASASLDMLLANPGLDGTPSRWVQNTFIGFLHDRLGNEEAAAERYAGTIAAGYGRETDYLRFAGILRKQGMNEEALDVLRMGQMRFPENIQLLSLSARILIATGRSGEALEPLRKMAAAEPAGPEEEKAVAWAKRLVDIAAGK